jgi:hypothetical protein
MSNSTRKHINRLCNELHRREQRRTVLVESRDAGRPDGEPSFHCYVGQELQARLTCKKLGVFKNVLYSVQSISRHDAVLRMSPEYSDGPQNASFPLAELARYFRMAYAVVYMNVQGRTIREGAVVLWNTLRGACPHRYLTMRHFVMGLQRVVDPRNLKIASYEQEREFLGAEARLLRVTPLAKWKTTAQMIAIAVLFLGTGLAYLEDGRPPVAGEGDLRAGLSWAALATHAGLVLIWVAGVLTALTGWDYFRKALPFLTEDRR